MPDYRFGGSSDRCEVIKVKGEGGRNPSKSRPTARVRLKVSTSH